MPEISSLMSASSSTMRISAAISFYPTRPSLCGLFFQKRHEAQGDAGAMTAVEARRRVVKHDAPLMLLHDAFDDRQTQSRSLRPRGHVGLGQAMPVFVRQADAVVGDADEGGTIFDARFDEDLALDRLILMLAGLYRLASILNQIGHRLGDKAPVEGEVDTFLGKPD